MQELDLRRVGVMLLPPLAVTCTVSTVVLRFIAHMSHVASGREQVTFHGRELLMTGFILTACVSSSWCWC